MIEKLKSLQSQKLITIQDAAVVSLGGGQEEAENPSTEQLDRCRRAGRRFLGDAVRPSVLRASTRRRRRCGIGALTGAMADVGIDDSFINRVKQRVTPGTSALFLLSSDAVMDRVKEELSGRQGELIASNLSAEQEAKLREVFAEE